MPDFFAIHPVGYAHDSKDLPEGAKKYGKRQESKRTEATEEPGAIEEPGTTKKPVETGNEAITNRLDCGIYDAFNHIMWPKSESC